MNVSIIIAVCYYIVLIAQFGIMWKAKNPGENEIFSITVPNEKLENEEIKGFEKKIYDDAGNFHSDLCGCAGSDVWNRQWNRTGIALDDPIFTVGRMQLSAILGCECQSKNIESRTSLYGWMFPSTDR